MVSVDQGDLVWHAVEADAPTHVVASWFHRSGGLILVPGSADPRCWLPEGFESHEPGCVCRWVVVHPDLMPPVVGG